MVWFMFTLGCRLGCLWVGWFGLVGACVALDGFVGVGGFMWCMPALVLCRLM